jgi:uncharacterized protein
MIELIEKYRAEIGALCRKYRVVRLALFGSAARADFDPERSDLDFLVEFEELGWRGSADRYFGVLHGLEDLLGRKIDLVDRKAVTSRIFMESATGVSQTIYAAAIAKAS